MLARPESARSGQKITYGHTEKIKRESVGTASPGHYEFSFGIETWIENRPQFRRHLQVRWRASHRNPRETDHVFCFGLPGGWGFKKWAPSVWSLMVIGCRVRRCGIHEFDGLISSGEEKTCLFEYNEKLPQEQKENTKSRKERLPI